MNRLIRAIDAIASAPLSPQMSRRDQHASDLCQADLPQVSSGQPMFPAPE